MGTCVLALNPSKDELAETFACRVGRGRLVERIDSGRCCFCHHWPDLHVRIISVVHHRELRFTCALGIAACHRRQDHLARRFARWRDDAMQLGRGFDRGRCGALHCSRYGSVPART
jgi:hypothetical protein